jgi:probable F420-dependent oxidoreductase
VLIAADAGRARDLAESSPVTGDLPLLGFGLPVAGSWATPDTMRRIARRAEELGYASLWTFQRVLYPADAGLDPAHRDVHDSVVALAHVAGHTDRIGLGTATLCAPFTAPALLAKTMASLDVLSGGRLTVGLGSGWLPQEYAAAGIPLQRRGARMDEYLRCLQALWTQDPVAFDGEFYTVPRSHVGPPPVQRPHPPVLLGGTATPALRRAGRLAQGWIGSSRHDLTQIGTSVETVRDGAREAGRDPQALRIVVRGLVDLVDDDPGDRRQPLHGTREQVLDDLHALRTQGVTEVFFDLNLSPRISAPGVDTADALAYAERVLDAFAPARR